MLALARARVRFLMAALRPVTAVALLLATLAPRLCWWKRALVAAACAHQWRLLMADHLFHASVHAKVGTLVPGVFHRDGASHRLISPRLRALLASYKAPWWARWGDLSTISFSVRYAGPECLYHRLSVASLRGACELDQIIDTGAAQRKPRAVLMLCGIGGDSASAYVRCLGSRLARQMDVFVLIPRGFGNSSPLRGLEELFDTHSIDDANAAVNHLASLGYEHLAVIGFSLGGVQTVRLLAQDDARLPEALAGGVAFSGALAVPFIQHDRYVTTYQAPFLVPRIAADLVGKHAHLLRSRLGDDGLKRVLNASTYEDLFTSLYVKAGLKQGTLSDFLNGFVTAPHSIARPLLVVTALDDPLHHAGMIGIQLDEAAQRLEPSASEQLVLGVTANGGHVAWPTAGEAKYEFMFQVAEEFLATVFAQQPAATSKSI